MGFQLASYKLRGQPCTTYEPVATRRFLHGRTEAMRPVTMESIEFTRKMMDPVSSDDEKADALRAAVQRHVARMKECKGGRGVDRHLLGLKNMYYLFGEGPWNSRIAFTFSISGIHQVMPQYFIYQYERSCRAFPMRIWSGSE